MKTCLLMLLLVLCCNLASQNCSCLDDYYFVKNHIEKNHGGFNKKIKSPDEPAYKKFTDSLETAIRNDKDGKHCLSYLKKYILFLGDHHSNISTGTGNPVNENDTSAVKAFLNSPAYRHTELIVLNEDSLLKTWKKNNPGPVEGVYYTPDSTYIVTVIKSKTEDRDYAGIILSSKTKLWAPGQVKFELKKVNDTLFDYFIGLRNHAVSYDQVEYKRNILFLGTWIKQGVTDVKNPYALDNELIRFSVLDSTTAFLSIRSFNAAQQSKLDSAYSVIIPQIKKYPKLIIDVRNNGGGSDLGYKQLMPLLFTDPFKSDVVEFFATPANINAYKEHDEVLQKLNPGSKPVFAAQTAMMEKATPYTFVTMGSGQPATMRYPVNKGYPEKIAVLYNKFCASSCESFLFETLNSSKTIRVGENSGGYTGYGNVMNIQTPCGNTLNWTTTVYRDQWRYEFVGIPPQYKVPVDETDWVEYTRKLLKD